MKNSSMLKDAFVWGIFLAVAIGGISQLFTSGVGTNEITGQAFRGCYDSDGGENYDKAGYVKFGGNTYKDRCTSSGRVMEYSCGPRNKVSTSYKSCTWSCTAGACVGSLYQGANSGDSSGSMPPEGGSLWEQTSR